MKTLILFGLVLFILYKIFTHPRVALYFIEARINNLRPKVIQHLHSEANRWKEILEKFQNEDKVVKTVFHDEGQILANIKNLEKDINTEQSYQLLRQKFSKNTNSLTMLARNYLIFIQCLDFFRSANGVDVTNLVYANTATEVGSKKSAVYKVFQELLNA